MGGKNLVLGYFGYANNQLDGQTIKTRNIFELLKEIDPNNLLFFDTQTFQESKLNCVRMIKKLWYTKKLIYLPAHGNLKYLFPLIFIFSKLFRFEIHYFVVGGWLPDFISKLAIHKYLLSKISGIYTETELMKIELESNYAFSNVSIFNNFRYLPNATTAVSQEKNNTEQALKLVFFSRINRKKGLDFIFYLGNFIKNNNSQCSDVIIDFYGPIFQEDKKYFDDNLELYEFIKYKGVVSPDNTNYVLSGYDALLLPTKYYTEGLPGAVIDAYFAGIPVIASRWKHADEFIDNNESGLIFKWNDCDDFINTVLKLFDLDFLNKLKKGASNKAEMFSHHEAKKKLINDLNLF